MRYATLTPTRHPPLANGNYHTMTTQPLDLAIVNGTVITMDAERRVLRGGAVGIRDGRIVAV